MLSPWQWEGGRNILGLSGWWVGLVETDTLRTGRVVRTFHVVRTKKVHASTKCSWCGGTEFAGDGREPMAKRFVPADWLQWAKEKKEAKEAEQAAARGEIEKLQNSAAIASPPAVVARPDRTPGLKIADTPAFGYAIHWIIYRRRLTCKKCRRPTKERLPSYIDTASAMTARCNVYVRHQAASRPYMDVANEVGIHNLSVRSLARDDYDPSILQLRQPRRLPKEDRVTPPRYLGIDEIAMIDRENAQPPHVRAKRTTFVDIETGNVLDILRDDAPASVEAWIGRLSPQEKARIRGVVIDMNGSYRAVVEKALPHSRLIIDRFHVETMAQKAVDRVRIDETKKDAHKALAKRRRQDQSRNQDEDVRAFARMLRAKEMPRQPEARHKLREYLNAHPKTCLAIEARQQFGLIYDTARDSEEAMMRFLMWQQGLDREIRYAFQDLITNFTKNGRAIVAYFDLRITNGPTESANAAMRKIIRSAPQMYLSTLREKVRARARLKPVRKFFCDTCRKRSYIEPEHHTDLKGDLVCRRCREQLPPEPSKGRVRWTVDALFQLDGCDRLMLKRPLSRRRQKAMRDQQVAMLFNFPKSVGSTPE